MKRFMTFFAILLCLSLVMIPVSAYELPHAFWAANDAYNKAIQSKDNHGIVQYGNQILRILENEPENTQIIEIRASRLDQIGLAHERLGDYISAGQCYEQYIPYAERMNWADGAKIARAKVLQYTPSLDLYRKTSPHAQYGAKNEPDGVLFGVVADGGTRPSIPNESMILLYMEFGDTYFDYINRILLEASQKGIAVELALNVPGEGGQIPQIPQQTDYITTVAKMIGRYNIPVYLRFGAEMNIWNDRANPDQFITAFRTVADIMRQHAPNAAMVWSVNQVSSWDIEMNDYYPGDEYVDWIGVSSYMSPYFLGRNDWSDNEKFNEVVFLTGNSSDPVKALTEVVTKYGDRKPIMLAESGASHYTHSLEIDHTAWAMTRLKQMYYNVPMVYPQVKLIAYFDIVINHERNEYALSTSPQLAQLYRELTSQSQFVQFNNDYASQAFDKCGNTIYVSGGYLPLGAYVHVFGDDTPQVDYYINDQWVSRMSAIPYQADFDLIGYSQGTYTLSAVVQSNGRTVARKDYKLVIETPISMFLNGQQLVSDVQPIIDQGRTLVPVRVISEQLGATVEWVEKNQEIIVTKGILQLKLQIGNPNMQNGRDIVRLEAPPRLVQERTLVPLRAIAEALRITVDWDDATHTIYMTQ